MPEERAELLRSTQARRERIATELQGLRSRAGESPGIDTRISNLGGGLARHDEMIRELEQLRRERDDAIRRAHKAGLPMSDMAEAFRLSRQRVAKIIGRKRPG
jgi:hypothetical protein